MNVHVGNPANFAQAVVAAQKLATALSKLAALLSSVPANTTVVWNGQTTTTSSVLADLNNTVFMVSESSFNNGGVGAASRGVAGAANRDEINYTYLIGPGSYGDPNYVNDQGLVGIALHELGHISVAGTQVNIDENKDYLREAAIKETSIYLFNSSAYWTDNEVFADQFQRTVGRALSIDLTQDNGTALTKRPQAYRGAANILRDHIGGN